jgi:hypothetical protein
LSGWFSARQERMNRLGRLFGFQVSPRTHYANGRKHHDCEKWHCDGEYLCRRSWFSDMAASLVNRYVRIIGSVWTGWKGAILVFPGKLHQLP